MKNPTIYLDTNIPSPFLKPAFIKPSGGQAMLDPLIENSRKVRDKLLKEFGGLQGLCDKLEEMDHARQPKAPRKRKTPLPLRSAKTKPSRSKPPKSS